jgi:hypothetical protein
MNPRPDPLERLTAAIRSEQDAALEQLDPSLRTTLRGFAQGADREPANGSAMPDGQLQAPLQRPRYCSGGNRAG